MLAATQSQPLRFEKSQFATLRYYQNAVYRTHHCGKMHFLCMFFSFLQVICVVFVCAAFTLDIFCLIFVPLHWLFFVASTYVLFNYIWHTGEWWLHCWLTAERRFPSLLIHEPIALLSSFLFCEQRKASAYPRRPCGFSSSTRRPRFASKTWRPLTPTCLISSPHTGELTSCVRRTLVPFSHFAKGRNWNATRMWRQLEDLGN